MLLFTIYEHNLASGVGGDSGQTHTQTHRGATGINNIDFVNINYKPLILNASELHEFLSYTRTIRAGISYLCSLSGALQIGLNLQVKFWI